MSRYATLCSTYSGRSDYAFQYGHTLQGIEYTEHSRVATTFTNGKRQIGAILIGADGSNSTVREILFGRDKAQLDPVNATWTPKPWHTRGGRVTLAGAAAHTMAPHSNKGLDAAIADAYNLVAAIKGVDTGQTLKAEAIPSYSLAIVARGRKQAALTRDVIKSASGPEKKKVKGQDSNSGANALHVGQGVVRAARLWKSRLDRSLRLRT